MDTINTKKKNCIIIGDFNIELLKCNIYNKTNNYIENKFAKGF